MKDLKIKPKIKKKKKVLEKYIKTQIKKKWWSYFLIILEALGQETNYTNQFLRGDASYA